MSHGTITKLHIYCEADKITGGDPKQVMHRLYSNAQPHTAAEAFEHTSF